jgi:hypothetical protein
VIPNSAATSSVDRPAAQHRMMRARCAKPWPVRRRRAHCSSVVRSLGLMTTRITGRPPRLTIASSLYTRYDGPRGFVTELQIRDTSDLRSLRLQHVSTLLLVRGVRL